MSFWRKKPVPAEVDLVIEQQNYLIAQLRERVQIAYQTGFAQGQLVGRQEAFDAVTAEVKERGTTEIWEQDVSNAKTRIVH